MFFKLINDFWNKYGWTIIFVVCIVVLFFIISFKRIFDINSSSNITSQNFWSQIFSKPIKKKTRQAKISKGEDECKKFAEFYFKRPFKKVRPLFLKNPITGAQLELDLYNEELKLAIEYNGAQHYIYNDMMHQGSREKFQNQQYRDYMKKTMCRENGVDLVIVPYTIKQEDVSTFLFDEFTKKGFSPAVLQ